MNTYNNTRFPYLGIGLLLKSAICNACKFLMFSGMSGISEIKTENEL